MEPITAVASAVVTLLFSEAFKEGGKALGKGVSDQVAQLISTIHQKFQRAGTEGLIVRAEKQPTESNIAMVEAELVTQMEDDKTFANQLEKLIEQLERTGITRQVLASGIEASKVEVGDMTQKAKQGRSVDQIMGSNLKVDGDVKFGDLNQEVN
jgi:hypothetical protein